MQAAPLEELPAERYLLAAHPGEVHLHAIRELVVVDLGEQQQGLVQPHGMAQRPLHRHHVSHGLLLQRGMVQQPVQACPKHGQRRLQLVRGVADELLLLLESLLRTFHGLMDSGIEPPELVDRGCFGKRLVPAT